MFGDRVDEVLAWGTFFLLLVGVCAEVAGDAPVTLPFALGALLCSQYRLLRISRGGR